MDGTVLVRTGGLRTASRTESVLKQFFVTVILKDAKAGYLGEAIRVAV
jgi:hypothetical protein